MKTIFKYKYFLLVAILGVLVVTLVFDKIFTSPNEKIEQLIQEHKLDQAKILIKQFLKEYKDDTRLIEVNSKLNYNLLKEKLNNISDERYIDRIWMINVFLPEIVEQKYKDSANSLVINYCQSSALYYKHKKFYIHSFECLIPLFRNNINCEKNTDELINEITRLMLTGKW